ncbi:uracil-DNA glycosylase [Limosilactobacillus gastricus]|uniref:uracil-DNA glycosylase n=1 Tax=Limosilactobacillus gastricus TaxID=227942 RepID=UPI0026EBDB22|nr:uracil-DNA glycosylase [Limosilactobacillus gastricus]
MQDLIHNDWWPVLKNVFETPAYQQLREFLINEYQTQTVYPPAEDIFNAFRWTPYSQVKVVILGQDPYHGPGQAHGCSFSVRPGVPLPPSLKNIYQELTTDVGAQPVHHGYLKSWADQGVLLLNAVLTVRSGQANSHRGMGWETITDAAIQALSQRPQPVVFILWGRSAQAKERLIDLSRNYVITSAHPSPLSAYRGFFGSRPFSRANLALQSWGVEPIDWQLPMNVTE